MLLTRHLIAYLLLGLFATWFCTQWTDFPYFYHADEPGKARQLLEDTRNFNHPLLMLETARAVWHAWGGERTTQFVAEAGRLTSALFVGLATVLLCLAVGMHRGGWVGLSAGWLLLWQPDVQEYARYFKEDPSLLFGAAAFFTALMAYERHPTWRRAGLLGVACALAASGKYVGAVLILPGIAWCLLPGLRKEGVLLRLGAFLLALCLVWSAINYRLLSELGTFQNSFSREVSLVVGGQSEVEKSIPHGGFYFRLWRRSWFLLPFALAGLAAVVRTRQRSPAEIFLVVSPLLLATLLAFSAKDSGRYFFPASLGIAAASAIGIAEIARWSFLRVGAHRAVIACILLATGLSMSQSLRYVVAFQKDPRRHLFSLLSEREEAKVVQGKKIGLPDISGQYADGWARRLPETVTVHTPKNIADFSISAASLRERGFTHVVVASDDRSRYYQKNAKAKSGREEEFNRRKAFFESLDAEALLIWHFPGGKVGTHQPELRLYELRD